MIAALAFIIFLIYVISLSLGPRKLRSDKNYIESLVEKCCKMGVLLRKGSVEKVQNSLASIEMTHRCNLQCIHCCIDANSRTDEMSTDEIYRSIRKIAKWNPDNVSISGGEPLVRRDIKEILIYLRKSI